MLDSQYPKFDSLSRKFDSLVDSQSDNHSYSQHKNKIGSPSEHWTQVKVKDESIHLEHEFLHEVVRPSEYLTQVILKNELIHLEHEVLPAGLPVVADSVIPDVLGTKDI